MDIREVPDSAVGKYMFKGGYILVGLSFSYILQASSLSALWLGVPIVVGFILLTWEYKSDENRAQQIGSQLSLLMRALSYSQSASVRCTFHVPREIDDEERLYQVVNYLPSGGGKGRDFSSEKGIIGNSYQNLRTLTENFDNSKDYRDKMVEEYGYTEEEMGNRTADRRSYLCKPVITQSDHNGIIGILYLDASESGTFPDNIEEARAEEDENIWLVYQACESIKESYLSSGR